MCTFDSLLECLNKFFLALFDFAGSNQQFDISTGYRRVAPVLMDTSPFLRR